MRLEVITPATTCVDVQVRRIVAEAPEGHFGILPNHGDFVSELVPGILVYAPKEGPDRFVALHSGTLVKCGGHVRVAVQGAIEGDDLAWLSERVELDFRQQDEDERAARAALARLEAGMIRRFRDLEGLG
ncbi:F0F1 ATP synthase subunit epsilon [Ruegeria marina]|uniref:F-type H+-transporting ATPase subunit epsilon n=1 Tax=Ruegeria marina TaxID=639004 RepID=A0A1G6I8C3_9RHOB|nr:F0F1 ATP synthase subunit epsilon [Ruegeria marina]SDC02688.1 F-type H+-transporting ATPase subunit epsilon [Ruegeria marina]